MSGSTVERASRRDAVLDAALTVMARDGIRAVTHRAVATEMGASVRAATYHFASIDALIEAAFARYVERALARFGEVRDALPERLDVDVAADALTMVVLGDLVGDREGLVVEYTLVAEMARRPGLESAYAAWQRSLEQMLYAVAVSAGIAEPERAARLVLATLRGIELDALAHPSRPVDAGEVRTMFARLLRGLA